MMIIIKSKKLISAMIILIQSLYDLNIKDKPMTLTENGSTICHVQECYMYLDF